MSFFDPQPFHAPLTLAFLDETDEEGAPLSHGGERVQCAGFSSPLMGEVGWG